MTIGDAAPQLTLVHGYCATPADHWFEWLAERARERGGEATVLAMPDSEHPMRDDWLNALATALSAMPRGGMLVGHSLGTPTVLRHLASRIDDWRLDELVLVSPFLEPVPGLENLDPFVASALDADDLASIKSRAAHRTVIMSDDDPIVPPEYSARVADLIGADTVVVPGGKHFTADAGYVSLDAALPVLERWLS